MILDTQDQKDLLINLIKTAGVSGNLEQARKTLVILEKLLSDIEKAEVKKK